MREHRVGGEDATGQRQHTQQSEGGFVFVGRIGDPQLPEDSRLFGDENAQQVLAGQTVLFRAAKGLAVEGDVFAVGPPRPQPDPQSGLECGRIESPEDLAEAGLVWGFAPAEPERECDRAAPVPSELGDGREGVATGHHGDGSERQDGDQGMETPVRTSGIGYECKGIQQRHRHREPPV